MMNKRLFPLLLALMLAACQPAGDDRPPLEGASMGGAFSLTNQDGKPVKDSDFAGQYRLVYFGYAYCPDVCPVDLQRLMQGFARLEQSDPAVAARIQPIFITIDPVRDTPATLKPFVAAFHPRLIGLTGSEADIAAVAKRYRVFFERQPKAPDGSYEVDHGRMTVLYGPKGEPVSRIPEAGTPDEIVAALKRWTI